MYFVTYKELDYYREYNDYVEEDKFKEFENLEDALKFIEENYSFTFRIRDVLNASKEGFVSNSRSLLFVLARSSSPVMETIRFPS